MCVVCVCCVCVVCVLLCVCCVCVRACVRACVRVSMHMINDYHICSDYLLCSVGTRWHCNHFDVGLGKPAGLEVRIHHWSALAAVSVFMVSFLHLAQFLSSEFIDVLKKCKLYLIT